MTVAGYRTICAENGTVPFASRPYHPFRELQNKDRNDGFRQRAEPNGEEPP